MFTTFPFCFQKLLKGTSAEHFSCHRYDRDNERPRNTQNPFEDADPIHFQCHACFEPFGSPQQLSQHQKQCESFINGQHDDVAEATSLLYELRFTCTCCNPPHYSKNITYHRRHITNTITRKKGRLFPCRICFQAFYTKRYLSTHIQKKHLKQGQKRILAPPGKQEHSGEQHSPSAYVTHVQRHSMKAPLVN